MAYLRLEITLHAHHVAAQQHYSTMKWNMGGQSHVRKLVKVKKVELRVSSDIKSPPVMIRVITHAMLLSGLNDHAMHLQHGV